MENFKIIKEKNNPLFNRREIEFEVRSNASPSRAEVGKFVSEKFSTSPEKVKIKKIDGRFGSNNFKITIFAYGSEEEKKKTERVRKKDSLHLVKEEPKAEETKQEEKAE